MEALLPLLLLFAASLPLKADVNTPLVGPTLEIDGKTYTWISPATEDANFHTDTYVLPASGYVPAKYITVRRGNSWTSNIAQVWGAGNIYLTWDQNGVTVHDGGVPAIPQSGNWVFEGRTYTTLTEAVSYWPDDATGQIGTYTFKTYTDSGGGTTRREEWSNGVWIPYYTQTEARSAAGPGPATGVNSHSLLGTVYSFVSSEYVVVDHWGSDGYYSYIDHYSSPDGGSIQISKEPDYEPPFGQLYGTDPYFGGFQASYPNPYTGTYNDYGMASTLPRSRPLVGGPME